MSISKSAIIHILAAIAVMLIITGMGLMMVGDHAKSTEARNEACQRIGFEEFIHNGGVGACIKEDRATLVAMRCGDSDSGFFEYDCVAFKLSK